MKNNNLLASVALFSELYNSDSYKSIPDILSEFIKGAVVYEKKFSLNSTELKDILKSTYGFNIPESVLRTTLKNRLKSVATKEFDNYHFDKTLIKDYDSFKSNVEAINRKQNNILSELYEYIESYIKIKLTSLEKEKIFENFSHFLMDNGFSDKYSELISAFVVSKESDLNFKEELGAIKEGLILYQGINYSADINQLGSWKDKLTIYLGTEHLFNCLGYNGILFEEIFNDFMNLVNEINKSQTNKDGEKLITLKYLEETNDEINNFFSSAESIKKGKLKLDSSKVAMTNILKGCKDVKDIREKQVNFFLELKRKRITLQEYSFDIEKFKYNVVDLSLIESLKNEYKKKQIQFNEEYCTTYLTIFTKINTFRRGKNNVPFEKIQHIYVTENNFAKYLGYNNAVKFGEHDTAFAKDIDYVISKFWFKLKKGFNDKAALPKTFDFVTKAKIIIASHINNSISEYYEKLQAKFKKGELTEEQAIELSHAYKEKPFTPDLVTPDTIDESLDFLNNENFIEDFLREKTKKETVFIETIREKNELEKELQKYKNKEIEDARLISEKEAEDKRKKELIQIKNDSVTFAQNEWLKIKSKNNSDVRYLFFTFLTTWFPIGIGLFLNLYSPIKAWLETRGNIQLIIWLVISGIFVIELYCRAYIFNKQKVKNGWDYLLIIISCKYKKNKLNKIIELRNNYLQNKVAKST